MDNEEDDDDDDDEPEHWDIPANLLDDDLGISVHPTPLKTINGFLFCVVYAILYLQAVHHISDNGVEYLLRCLTTSYYLNFVLPFRQVCILQGNY